MRVLVTPERGAAFESDFFDFVADNEIPADEIGEMVCALHAGGEYILGGGGAPFVTLERIKP